MYLQICGKLSVRESDSTLLYCSPEAAAHRCFVKKVFLEISKFLFFNKKYFGDSKVFPNTPAERLLVLTELFSACWSIKKDYRPKNYFLLQWCSHCQGRRKILTPVLFLLLLLVAKFLVTAEEVAVDFRQADKIAVEKEKHCQKILDTFHVAPLCWKPWWIKLMILKNEIWLAIEIST